MPFTKVLHGSICAAVRLVSVLSYLVDGLQDVLSETTAGTVTLVLDPLLLSSMVELVTPQTLHQLLLRHLELAGVQLGEVLEGEGPAMQAGAKPNGADLGVHL